MPEPLTETQMNDLRQRIYAAKQGQGPFPTREELREAYNQLRNDRTILAGKRAAKKASTSASLPSDLNDLF